MYKLLIKGKNYMPSCRDSFPVTEQQIRTFRHPFHFLPQVNDLSRLQMRTPNAYKVKDLHQLAKIYLLLAVCLTNWSHNKILVLAELKNR